MHFFNRGDEPDYGYVPRLDTPENNGVTASDAQVLCTVSYLLHLRYANEPLLQGVAAPKRRSIPVKDPTWEDMLIAYATVPGYVANRNINRGTWFVESICQVDWSTH